MSEPATAATDPITTFASGLAHEIKNPLSAVVTHAVLMVEALDRLPSATRRELEWLHRKLHLIIAAASSCARTVDRVGAYARQSAGRLTSFPLHQMIDEVLQSVAPAAGGREIVISCLVAQVDVLAERVVLRRAMRCVLGSAVSRLERGGALAVRGYRSAEWATVDLLGIGVEGGALVTDAELGLLRAAAATAAGRVSAVRAGPRGACLRIRLRRKPVELRSPAPRIERSLVVSRLARSRSTEVELPPAERAVVGA